MKNKGVFCLAKIYEKLHKMDEKELTTAESG